MIHIETLEKRVTALEQELQRMKQSAPRRGQPGWLKRIDGRHAGDEAFAEVIRLGREIRLSERPVDET